MAENTLRFNFLVGKNEVPAAAQKNEHALTGLATKTASFGKIAAVALGGAAVAAGGLAAAGVVMGVKTAASLEQAQIGFTTLLGSSRKAGDYLTKLKAFAAATPFELNGLIESSRSLLGVGVNANDAMKILQTFGDTAAAVGISQESFQRIMVATSQAIGAGKFMTQDLNQIMNNGIPIWTILSKAMGKPIPVLRDMASQGKLLSKDVLPVLEREMHKDYGGAMARQSQTLAGLWSTLMDTLSLGLASVIQPMLPTLKNLATNGIAFLGAAFAKLPGIISAVGGFMSRLQPVFTAATGWIMGDLVPAVRELAARAFPALQGMVRNVAAAFADHRDAVAAVGAVFRGLGLVVTRVLVPALGIVFDVVTKSVAPAVRGILTLVGGIATAVEKLPAVLSGVADFGRSVIRTITSTLTTNPVAKAIGAVVSAIMAPFVAPMTRLVKAGKDIVGGLVSGINAQTFARIGNGLRAATNAVINAIEAPFIGANKMLQDTGVQIVSGLAQGMGASTPMVSKQAAATRAAIDVAFRSPAPAAPYIAGITFGTLYAKGLTVGLVSAADVIRTFMGQQLSFMSGFGPRMFAQGLAGGIQFGVGISRSVAVVMAAVHGFVDAVQSPFNRAKDWLIVAGSRTVGGFVVGMQRQYGATAGAIAHLIGDIVRAPFRAAGSWLVGPGSNTVGGMNRGIRMALPQLGGLITGLFINTTVKRPFLGAIDWLTGAGRNYVRGLLIGIAGMVTQARRTISGVVHIVRDPFGAAGTWLISAGSNVLTGFMIGLRRAWGSVTSWVSGIASWIRAHKGPVSLDARLLIPAGEAIMSGFLRGLKSGAGPAWNFVKTVGGKTVDMLRAIYAPVAGMFATPGSTTFGKGVSQWSSVVLQALSMLGQPASWLGTVLARMQRESGGNPRAINLWDINAQRGDPSRGLMQTIGSTFNAYAGSLRGRGIYDPLANVYAGLNYAIHTYGSLAALNRPGGYDAGGIAAGRIGYLWKGTTQPERVLSPRQTASFERLVGALDRTSISRVAAVAGGGSVQIDVHVHGDARGFEDQLVASMNRVARNGRLDRSLRQIVRA